MYICKSINKKTMKKTLLLFILCAAALLATAQNYERYGGVYFAYPETPHTQTPPPPGYEPCYITMFTRHGSRWLPDDKRYEDILRQFADTANLTPLGKDVRRRLLLVWADARGRGGDLTARGARQMAGMARRMVQHFPSVFANGARVRARSSVVGRCIMSMNAFLVSLAQERPNIKISAEANRRYMDYIAFTSPEEHELEGRIQNRWTMAPARLMTSLFIHPDRVTEPRNLASELHTIASDMQNVEIGVNLYDIFTEPEMRAIYDMNNERMEKCNGINATANGVPERCAESLWRHIAAEADSALAAGSPAASLIFGHDTSLYRFLSLLGLYKGEKRMDRIIPMGANLQMVFYKQKKGGQVLVKLLHNEEEIALPIVSQGVKPPYYRWQDVKNMVNNNPALNQLRIAFIADAHIQDVESHPLWVRTMDAEIHSTRLFNENIFAFRAALDDVARRGIRLVVLPGDITDNGQTGNIKAVASILNEYVGRYGMQFFTTTGNHDPASPFGAQAVEGNYLSPDGRQLFMASAQGLLPADAAGYVDTLLYRCGYREIMNTYRPFGMAPQPSYLYWATPFSSYDYDHYSLERATEAAQTQRRTFELAGTKAIDASYVVEPVKGLWLLSIDGGVYFPSGTKGGVQTYKGSQAGYNNVPEGKPFLLPWIARVAAEAKRRGKTLVAFCHYPAIDFNNGMAQQVAQWWGKKVFNISRAPSEEFSKKLADTGLNIHFAGHIHVNNTAAVKGHTGNVLYNFQVPSTALGVPAYKILTVKGADRYEVGTVVLDTVPRFNSLFDRYRAELTHEEEHGRPTWDTSLLQAHSYPAFCLAHFNNLLRVRLLPEEMPEEVRSELMAMTAGELMGMAGLKATTPWTGQNFVADLYLYRYAGQPALRHIPAKRMANYKALIDAMKVLPARKDEKKENLRRLCLVWAAALAAPPTANFEFSTKEMGFTQK